MIPILLSVGLSQGIAPLVGYCYGGNDLIADMESGGYLTLENASNVK